MMPISVVEIGSRLDPHLPSLDWLDEIYLRATVYLEADASRAGANLLASARRYAMLAKKALEAGDAHGAVFAGMAALQAAWKAEITEGWQMIDAGVTAYRKAEAEN